MFFKMNNRLGESFDFVNADAAGVRRWSGLDAHTMLMLHLDGDAADASGAARADITAPGISYGEGKFGSCAEFTGSTAQKVAIPYGDTFYFSGDFSIDFWVKPSDSTRRGLLSFTSDIRLAIDTIAGVYSLWASSNGSQWNILQADSTNSDLTGNSGRGSVALTPGVWQHLAMVHAGTNWYLFVDGVQSVHKVRSGNVSDPAQELRIGRYGADAVAPWNGMIDEFRISSCARWTESFTPPARAYC